MAKIDREKAEKDAIRDDILKAMQAEKLKHMELKEKKRLLRLQQTLEESNKYKSPPKRIKKNLFGQPIIENNNEDIKTASSEGKNNPRNELDNNNDIKITKSRDSASNHNNNNNKLPNINNKLPNINNKNNKKQRHKKLASPLKEQILQQIEQEKALPQIKENEIRDRVRKQKEYGMKILEMHPPIDYMLINIKSPVMNNKLVNDTSPSGKLYQKQLDLKHQHQLNQQEYENDNVKYMNELTPLLQPLQPQPRISPRLFNKKNKLAIETDKKLNNLHQKQQSYSDEEVRGFDSPRSTNDSPINIHNNKNNFKTNKNQQLSPRSNHTYITNLNHIESSENLLHKQIFEQKEIDLKYKGSSYLANLMQSDGEAEQNLREIYENGFALLMQE